MKEAGNQKDQVVKDPPATHVKGVAFAKILSLTRNRDAILAKDSGNSSKMHAKRAAARG